MKHIKHLGLLLIFLSFFAAKKNYACHALPLQNFGQINYTPGVGLFINAASDPATCGCAEYWLDMEIRCNGNAMNGSGLSAGVWDSVHCFPFYQSAKMLKPTCILQNYPGIIIPDSILCPGQTYQYRLRENHNFQVGPWTPIMSYTMPGVLDTTHGSLVLSATPQFFCGSTQLGWTWTPGGGCGTSGCNTDTSYQWYVISGEPINVPVNFSCDTCPYPVASPSITTTYGLNITIGDSNACGYGIYTMTPITVTPLDWSVAGPVTVSVDCQGNGSFSISGYQGSLQWQYSNGGPFNNIPGEIYDTLSQVGLTMGDCFRLEIVSSCNTIYSDTVCIGQLIPPTTGTVSYTADCNGNVNLNLTGHQGYVQWQISNGGPFMDISGATLDSLLQAGVVNGDCFRAVISSECDTTVSDTVCPIIPEYPVTGIIDYYADCKNNVSLWVTGAQGNLQWQSSIAAGPWNNISGATMDSLLQAGINTGDCFRVMISTICDTIYTDTICPTMLQGPTAMFSYSPPGNSQSNVPMSFTDLSLGNIVAWDWDFGGGNPGQNDHIPNPTHTYHNSGSYTVTLIVTDANGCMDTISIVINIGPQHGPIIVPNVFTPNGDNENDRLVFKNLEAYSNHLQVYNRWGKVVFEATNYNNDWDGDDLSVGTYFFILELDNPDDPDQPLYKGAVNLLR